MAELQVKNRKALADCDEPFDNRDNFSKVIRFGDEKLEAEMRGYIAHINDRNENARITDIYENAQSKMQSAESVAKYTEAARIFKSISGFKDADELAEKCHEKVKDGMSLLLVSKQALDCQQYNSTYTDVTWENCSLRKWMNGTFLNNAFSAEEQAQIQNANVSADKNPEYSTNPGNATTDKVFLLSITEAEKYFSYDYARQCKPTKYVIANGGDVNSDNGNCWW